ncbi:MFS transporter, partial [Bacillus cereus]|nr:MFS transporter [Bacillus cereus]
MLKPLRLRLGNFQFFNGLEGSGEAVIETASSSVEGGESALPQGTGEVANPPEQIEQSPLENNPEGQPPAGQPLEDIEQSEAFAKRLQERTQAALMAERGRWEQEAAERYGNYDTYDRAMNFFMKQAGYNDLDSMM